VADAGASEVKVFDLNNQTLLHTLGQRARSGQPAPSRQAGEFINGSPGRGPGGVAVSRNRVYVTDLATPVVCSDGVSVSTGAVHVFDRQQGTPLHPPLGMPPNPWPGGPNLTGGPNYPFNIPGRIAIYGNEVYVTDSLNHRVQVFDPDGKFLWLWGGEGPTQVVVGRT
jgi:DNA-binding beta-propeller fold protein YncE